MNKSLPGVFIDHAFCMKTWLMAAVLWQPLLAKSEALLEISDFSKPGEKKTVPLTSSDPMLFNIEFFEGWSHCEVSANTHSGTHQTTAWLRCVSQEEVQVGMVCQGNDRQTVVFGHKDNRPKRGSLTLVCRSD